MYVRLPVLESYIRLCPIADVRLDLQRLQRRGSLACDSDRHLHDPVRRGSLPADAYLPDTPGSKCGSWLACDCLTHQHNFTGCSRDAGLAAPRHGWRVAAPPLPPNHWRITGTPSLSEVPSGGARAFCLLCRSCKVSRRQGGTLCGRYRSNGYVHNPTVLTARPPSRASPLPQVDRGVSVSRCRLAGRHRRQASSHIWSAERLAVITAMRQPDKPAPTEDFCIL